MLAGMPRIARAVVVGEPYHVTQRGNNRQDVFFTSDDRRYYLALLKHYADDYHLEVLGYCLMTNHIHLLCIPDHEDSLARAIGRTHLLYTQYINAFHGRSGHLWQGRFFSALLDGPHMWYALRYVERNPVRARLVRKAWRYPWSSAAAHTDGSRDASGLLDLAGWRKRCRGVDWAAQLQAPQDDKTSARLRLYTRTGRPLGSDRFMSKIESLLGKRLRPRPVGRPKNNRSSNPKEKRRNTAPK